MNFDNDKLRRIASRITATFGPKHDDLTNTDVPAGVMDVVGNRKVYVSDAFKHQWENLGKKFGREKGARQEINDFYRKCLQAIKNGNFNKTSGGVNIRQVKDVPGGGRIRFYECKSSSGKIGGTDLHPRIYFSNNGSDSILLAAVDKNSTAIDGDVLNNLASAHRAAINSNYQETYSEN